MQELAREYWVGRTPLLVFGRADKTVCLFCHQQMAAELREMELMATMKGGDLIALGRNGGNSVETSRKSGDR